MNAKEQVNILLVDDQPGKLLSYEVILRQLGENLISASSGREALEQLLKNEIAVILVDVCMPELDGFELASMIREHPRYQRTSIIFISAIHLTEFDSLRGYELGAVDYVPVPVVPEVLRAKVRVFVDLYRKTRELERLNNELEERVAGRTRDLERSTTRLLESEQRRNLALAAGQMGSWEWDRGRRELVWDSGQYRICGLDEERFTPSLESAQALVHPDDLTRLLELCQTRPASFQVEARVIRPNGQTRWCICAGAITQDENGDIVRASGVTLDITDRKKAEEHQLLLAREVDHRAKNALAVVQSIVRLTRSDSVETYVAAVEGRVQALARTHTLLAHSRWEHIKFHDLIEEELRPHRTEKVRRITYGGPDLPLEPSKAQAVAMTLHELITNSAKYGALSASNGSVAVTWDIEPDGICIRWSEANGPAVAAPTSRGFGLRLITSTIEGQFGGRARFEWNAAGLACTFFIPGVHKKGEQERGEPRLLLEIAAKTGAQNELSGRRALIVEDEALIAETMAEFLRDLGMKVIGPAATVSDALRLVEQGEAELAVLDVNVNGTMVYPVADLLVSKAIPFVFVTGYEADGIPERFRASPNLRKPVDFGALISLLAGSLESSASRASQTAEFRLHA